MQQIRDVMKLTAAVNQYWYRPLFWLTFRPRCLRQNLEKSKEQLETQVGGRAHIYSPPAEDDDAKMLAKAKVDVG